MLYFSNLLLKTFMLKYIIHFECILILCNIWLYRYSSQEETNGCMYLALIIERLLELLDSC